MPSVCPTPFNISNAYPIPAPLTLGIPRSRCSTPALPPTSSLACTLYWHHVPLPPRVNLHTGTIGTPFLCLPLHPSCLHPLPPPRLHCHGPVPASSSPLTSTWGFHVADAAHRGVTMPSVCPTPFNISNAYPLPAPSSPRSRCSTPSCPLLTLGIPHSRCSTPRCPHVFCATTHASPCLLSAPHLFCLPSWGRRHWAAALKYGKRMKTVFWVQLQFMQMSGAFLETSQVMPIDASPCAQHPRF